MPGTDDNAPLTHFDAGGAAHMVAITQKPESPRMAVACARVRMSQATFERVSAGRIGKGDVLGVARLAGIGGSKQTSTLIPLCHPVRVTAVDIGFELLADLPGVAVTATVHAFDRTGPEMEAMQAATTAALTIYDMCKAIDRSMAVESVVLLEKAGGKSGHWRRE